MSHHCATHRMYKYEFNNKTKNKIFILETYKKNCLHVRVKNLSISMDCNYVLDRIDVVKKEINNSHSDVQ